MLQVVSMIEFIAFTICGAFAGFIVSIIQAAASRDGIWPDASAILIIVGALCGAAIGGLGYVI